MSEIVDFSGRYNSTYDFVNRLNLTEKAKELWGADWEAELDAEQIHNLIKFLKQDYYYVSVLEHVDEDDILVTKIDGLVELENYKEACNNHLKTIKELTTERDNYKEAYNELMSYWDSLPDDEKEGISDRLNNLGL